MEIITDILYWISTGLLVPVIVALILLFVRSLMLIGSFFGQYMAIRNTWSIIRTALNGVSFDSLCDIEDKLPKNNNLIIVNYIRQIIKMRDNSAEVERLISEYEIEAEKDLSTSKMLSKLGPMLGLMGTLIPMGPALAGLASGDIDSMARNMQVAFSTTVTGLVAAAIGFVTQQVKQRWYMQSMTQLEFLAEVIKQNNSIRNNETTF